MSTLAAAAIYQTTARIFDRESAFWALLIFGMSAISIDVGQFAAYDAPLVLCLAWALFFVVRAAEAPGAGHQALLSAASCASVGILSKYIGAIYLPALVCVAGICALRQRQPLWPIITSFALPVLIVVGGYGWLYRSDLIILLHGEPGVARSARSLILNDIWLQIGPISLVGMAGLSLRLWRALSQARRESPLRLIAWITLIAGLSVGVFAAPIYHLALANLHAAWKHTVYSLILIAPLAGYLCAQTIAAVRGVAGNWRLPARLLGLIGSIAIVAANLNSALDLNYGFQKSWPDVSGAVAYLRGADIHPDDPVLAAGSQIYEYYLDLGPARNQTWANTWYLHYQNHDGLEAMQAAVDDHYFRWVILDDYYTPEIDRALEPDLISAGYRLVYHDVQQTTTSVDANVRIYQRP